MNANLSNIKAKPPLFLATIFTSLVSTSAFAANSCDVNLTAGFTVNIDEIEFFNEGNKRTLYKIVDDDVLSVAGQKIELNSQQQQLISHYSTSIKAMVPKVRSVAIEGVDLALEGVNLAFDELLGAGNHVGADLTKELLNLRDEVAANYSLEHGFTLGNNGLTHDDLFDEAFEGRVQATVEKAVMNSMGSIMVALGQEMLTSGGAGEGFTVRMEKFGESIKNRMKAGAETLEHKAEKICKAAFTIDKIEEQLQSSISVLAEIDVFTVIETERDFEHLDKRAM